MGVIFGVLVVTGLIRYFIATERTEAIWGVVAIIAVAIISGSGAATAITAVLVVAALLAIRWLNRV